MAAQGQRLKQHMKDTVIPAIQQVQKVHETLDEEGISQILVTLLTRGALLTMLKSIWHTGPAY